LDPESFKGVHNRLSELGGVVLEAVEKMSFAYFSCKNVPLHVSEQTGARKGQRLIIRLGTGVALYVT
jgi:hypothetical protein